MARLSSLSPKGLAVVARDTLCVCCLPLGPHRQGLCGIFIEPALCEALVLSALVDVCRALSALLGHGTRVEAVRARNWSGILCCRVPRDTQDVAVAASRACLTVATVIPPVAVATHTRGQGGDPGFGVKRGHSVE